jgi:hypothetical protein
VQNLNPTVPPVPWRSGDFSNMSTTIYDPLSGQPFEGNKIPAERISTVSKTLQDRYYPLPNYGDPSAYHTQNYRELKARPYDPNSYMTFRGDQNFSERDFLYGRFTLQRAYTWPYVDNLPTLGQQYQMREDKAAMISETHTFRPNMVNEFRWGFSRNEGPLRGPVNGPQIVKDLGLVGLAPNLPDIAGMLNVTFSGTGTVRQLTQPNYSSPGYGNYTNEFTDHFSWFHGRHNAKFGARISHVSWYDYSANTSLFGNVAFTGNFTNGGGQSKGISYADFLLGIPTTARRADPPLHIDRYRMTYDFFVTDDFKVNSRLTVNLGVRYELHPGWQEKNKTIAIFDLKSGGIVIPDGGSVSPLFPKSFVPVLTASQAGLPNSLIRTDRNNFAPRLGVAYRPWDNRTVFRAGYGLFYDITPFHDLDMGAVSPFVLGVPAYTNSLANPQVVFPRVFPDVSTGGYTTASLPKAVNPNLRTPYSHQYNFTIEREQWNTGFKVYYIGTAQRHGWWRYDYNSPMPDAQPYIAKPRPFMNYPEIYYITNGAGHQYNGLTVEAMRYMSKGFYTQTSWTWARDRYDMDYNWDLDPSEYTVENVLNRHRDVGPARNIPTHRFVSNVIYQLPFGRGQHWLHNVGRLANLAVGGWEISTLYTALTGEFLTPTWTGPDPTGTAFTDGDPAEVTRRPNMIGNPNLPAGQRSLTRWFDASAFAPLELGQFGTSGRGVIKGPGVNVWHIGLFKVFSFGEKAPRLRWEITATNAFNHPNWSNPYLDITDPGSVGTIDSVGGVSGYDATGPRTLRTGLRLEW